MAYDSNGRMTWRGCRYVPYPQLPREAQAEARQRFSPAGRRMGYEKITSWAFALRKDGRLARSPYIEPIGSQGGK